MNKFDEKDIPPGWQAEKKDGVFANFNSDGSLKHYGLYRQSDRYFLEIDQDNLTASFDEFKKKDFQTNLPPGPERDEKLFAWAKDWIGKIESYQQDCSFCGLSQSQVRKVICGPRHSICTECVKLCQEIVAESEQKATTKKSEPSEGDGI